MPERKKSRSLLAGVRLGRSPAGPSSSPSRRRRSGSGGRRVGVAVRPAPASRSRPRPRREGRALSRSASEPALWLGTARVQPAPQGLSPPSPPPPPLERPHTCFDVFTPDSPFGRSASAASLSNCNPWGEAKVVVSVAVEGSVGPVKAMVRLGASVGEAIAAVVERYAKEGRSPRLDPAAAEAFQLHHSHFCLQSLNKNDKIGDVGGRNFYLHKNDGNNRIYLRSEESDVNLVGGEIAQSFGGQQIVALNHDQFFAIVIKKLDKIGRLTKRIWRLLTCNCT
ncbi:hypothetical protein E2562_031154 [Oryza meyeriana var. granulata]|uniref:DUF7054 domain-containing protein n=1 Tax=Oryza meyeriana var. granulata TaxID=110450 RepID=A0A6G1FE73_9ORYZ|nr:hypothetical protein E2562_031154 [Oryza meyeriana var. granulata]